MLRFTRLLAVLALALAPAAWAADCASSALQYDETPLGASKAENLCTQYHGKVVLVVNTASASPQAGQYRDLEALYNKYKSRGFVVLAFPSNDFKHEPLKATALARLLKHKYGVTYPVFKPIHVTGPKTDYLYRDLFLQAGIPPSRDFDKYIIGRNGDIVGYYASQVPVHADSFNTVIQDQLSRPVP